MKKNKIFKGKRLTKVAAELGVSYQKLRRWAICGVFECEIIKGDKTTAYFVDSKGISQIVYLKPHRVPLKKIKKKSLNDE